MEWVAIMMIAMFGLPAIGVTISEMHKRQTKFRIEQMRLTSEQTAEKAAQYVGHIERLEQRVRVLERIVTDKGFATAMAIEDLRDNPQISSALPDKSVN
jgi:hypothetical protein